VKQAALPSLPMSTASAAFPGAALASETFILPWMKATKQTENLRPRRGVGRRERRLGPLKEGFFMPPHGVATWMISRRWLSLLQMTNPELVELLKDLVVDPPGFDWSHFLGLGGEDSEDDVAGEPNAGGDGGFEEIHLGHGLDFALHYIPHSDNTISTSSLHNALAPV